MSITERITRAAQEFSSHVAEPRTPTKLLLGLREWEELEAWAWENFQLVLENLPGRLRSEYRGMKVYLMDDESYVGVAA